MKKKKVPTSHTKKLKKSLPMTEKDYAKTGSTIKKRKKTKKS